MAVSTEPTESAEPTEPVQPVHASQPFGLLWLPSEPPAEVRGLILAVVLMTGVPTLALMILEDPVQPGTLAALAVVLCSLGLSLWLLRRGLRPLPRRTLIAVLTLAAIALISAYLLVHNPITVLATGGPFAFVAAWNRPRWVPAAAGLVAIGIAILAASFVGTEPVAASDVVQMGVVFGASLIGLVGTCIDWQVKQQLDLHHAEQNELSLARERLRFATDLHDIQGHTLLAIKMKAELARRSLERDPQRVTGELRDIEALAAEAGDRTRDLAQGYRTLTLSAELTNLDQLLTAAGIEVHIDRGGMPAAEHEELFAALVREAASNILRHADARKVHIGVTPTTVTVANDGAVPPTPQHHTDQDEGGHGGNGLIGLERRFRTSGGHATWSRDADRFTVTGNRGGST